MAVELPTNANQRLAALDLEQWPPESGVSYAVSTEAAPVSIFPWSAADNVSKCSSTGIAIGPCLDAPSYFYSDVALAICYPVIPADAANEPNAKSATTKCFHANVLKQTKYELTN